MEVTSENIQVENSNKQGKLKNWAKLLFVTGGAQAVVQAVSLISGIIVIRLLPTTEYALYTLANTMLGTMTLLADGGISNGVMAHGGRVWQDREKMGTVLTTGLDLRKKFAVVSLLIVLPLLTYLLRVHDASWLACLLIVGALIPAFLAALSDSLLEIPLKLHQEITSLQKNQIVVGILRLVLLCLLIFIFPFTYIALLATGLPRAWGNIRLKKITTAYADPHAPKDSVIQKDMLKIVKRVLPGVVYYCLSGQITIWLISVVGSTKSLAQIGALGRLSAVLTLFSIVFNTLIQPRFARLPNSKGILLKFFLKAWISVLVLSVLIVVIVALCSHQFLWVLGKQYSNLPYELILSVVGGCLSTLISGAAFNLCLSRGWVMNPVVSITINVLAIVVGVLIINISSLKGVLWFNIFVASVQVIMNLSYILLKMIRIAQPEN